MEEVIHPVEEVIHTLGILLSALGPNFGLGPGLDNYQQAQVNTMIDPFIGQICVSLTFTQDDLEIKFLDFIEFF